jgi:uncharacterized protein (TIRG00374 family)
MNTESKAPLKRSRVKKTAMLAAKLLLAAALLALVFHKVHWGDYVVLADGSEPEVARVQGDSLEVQSGRWWWSSRFTVSADQCRPIAGSTTIVRRGFVTSVAELDKLLLLGACGGFVVSVLVIAVRWCFLLRLLDIRIRLWECVRLTFLGQFFNTVVPGTVGGDLVKAYFAAKHTPRKAAALVSIFVDRVLGLAELTLLGGVMLIVTLAAGLAPAADLKFAIITVPVVVALLVVSFALLLSARLRRALHLQKLYSRLPIAHHFAAAGEAATMYRRRLGSLLKAVAITFGGHLVWIGSISLIGMSLNLDVPLYKYFLYVPLIYIIGAVPLTPGGVGIIEGLYVKFFAPASPSAVVAMALIARLIPIFWGLPGLWVYLRGARVPKAAAMEAELAQDESAAG